MKINNKGFTLIELLAVVVILLAISMIAITSISAAIERNKAQQDEKRKAIIVSQGELYYDLHKNSFAGETVVYIPLGELGLTEDELKDSNGEIMSGCVKYDNGSFSFETDLATCETNIIG